MNEIPIRDLKSIQRIESQFDSAYVSLLFKLGHECRTDRDQDQDLSKSEIINNNDDDKDRPINLDFGQSGDKRQTGSSSEESDQSVEKSETGNDDYGTQDESIEEEEEEKDILDIDSELINLPLCFAKLMTKTLLAVERSANLERQVAQLQQENCKLCAIVASCCQLNKVKNKSTSRQLDSSKSTISTTNLNEFKDAINKEIESLIANHSTTIQSMERRYKNQIYGLSLAVDYLRRELSGRVQQLQIYDQIQMSNNGNNISPQWTNIWNHLIYEIVLNRHKTIIRMVDVSEVDDDTNECEMENLCSMLINGCHLTRPQLIDYTKLGQLRFVSLFVEQDERLGMVISGGQDRFMALVIYRIVNGSVAHRCGQLKPGDIILSIQNHDIIGMEQKHVAQLLRSISGWCRLGIVRLPHLDNNDRNGEKLLKLSENFELFHDDFIRKDNKSDQSSSSSSMESEEQLQVNSDSNQTECESHSEEEMVSFRIV